MVPPVRVGYVEDLSSRLAGDRNGDELPIIPIEIREPLIPGNSTKLSPSIKVIVTSLHPVSLYRLLYK